MKKVQRIKRISKFVIIVFAAINFINGRDPLQLYYWGKLVYDKDADWYATENAREIAENVLLYQRNAGGWPKNIPMHLPLSDEEKEKLIEEKSNKDCTTDNHATTLQMDFLSKVYAHQPDERYKKAFLKALDYLLKAQYDNGGWPQFYPLHDDYSRHITYNDNSMVNILTTLKEIVIDTGFYSIKPDPATIDSSKIAFDKGIECILNTQYIQNGKLTSWCAQHDEITLAPAKARSYELESLSGSESARIVMLLMSLDNPNKRVKDAINGAVEWFEETKISGLKLERYKTEDGTREIRTANDPEASVLWARFMELSDNTPFFCDRDGIKKYSIEEIGHERRTGYGWYSNAPQEVLDKYPEWKEKWNNDVR